MPITSGVMKMTKMHDTVNTPTIIIAKEDNDKLKMTSVLSSTVALIVGT